MITKTITIYVPEPGDPLPFNVLPEGSGKPQCYYNELGEFVFNGVNTIFDSDVAQLLGIPAKFKVVMMTGDVDPE